MAAKRVATRLGGLIVLLLLCVALFDVPSAYAVAAGRPRWLAWTVGLLAFPIVPLLWNILAERGRAAPDAKKPAKSTRWERVWMRTVAVAVLVIGGMFGMARGKAWRAVRHHALWFIPTTPGQLVPDSPLLTRVPASAKGLLWLRDTEAAQDALVQLGALKSGVDFELVIATDDKHGFATERGDVRLIETLSGLLRSNKIVIPGVDTSVLSLPDGSRTWTSPGWSMGSVGPTALLDLLRRAPDDAFLVGAVHDMKEIKSAVGWVGGRDGELELMGELTATSEAEAKKLVDELDREMPKKGKELACWRTAGGESSITRDGATVKGRAAIRVTEIRALFLCLDLKD
jgi:hypothetical protein